MRPITANDLMNPTVLTVRADMTLDELAVFLLDNEITGAPVEDPSGKLVGVVSVVDIARVASQEKPDEKTGQSALFRRPVGDVMTPEVYSVSEDATVSEIAATMVDYHLHRLLVTRADEPVGIISTSDLLGLLIDEDDD